MLNAVTVTDTDINSHKQKSQVMFLKRRWSVNARNPLSHRSMEFPLMMLMTQSILPSVNAEIPAEVA